MAESKGAKFSQSDSGELLLGTKNAPNDRRIGQNRHDLFDP
jgi:hypothetical protein